MIDRNDRRRQLTLEILKKLGADNYKSVYSSLWTNIRKTGGYGLTLYGYNAFTDYGWESWIVPSDRYHLSHIHVKLMLDKYFPCPYHISFPRGPNVRGVLHVFDSRIAVLIPLHGGLKAYIDGLVPDMSKN